MKTRFLDVPEFITCARGQVRLLVGQHRYSKDYVAGKKTRWRCVKKNSKCHAALYTIDDTIVKITSYHNHD